MDFTNYDIYFPNLGLGIEHLKNSISPFGFRIAYYGIIIGIGMLLGIGIASYDYKRRGKNPDVIQDFALYAVILSILGARVYYVIFQWDYYSQHLSEILAIRQGGLAIYGGVITGIICCIVFTKVKKIHFFDIGDSAVLGLILGQAIGRWGNFFNAEAFGGFTDSVFAMRIKESIVNPNMLGGDVLQHVMNIDGIDYIQVHPTFLYESCWNFLVFVILFVMGPKKKFEGQIFFMYLGLYGLGRFFIEGLRADSLMLWGTNIAVSQALSLCLVLISSVSICLLGRKAKRKTES